MKAFLLAAGHGTRLRPLTDHTPKCLLPVGGVPLLRIWLELCAIHAIDEVLVNIHSHPEAIREYLAKENGHGLRVEVSEERVLLGSAGTLLANREFVAGEECFWILYADVLTNADLSAMLAVHRSSKLLATLGLYEVPDPTRCGIVKLDEAGIIREFVEKPAVPASRLAFTGVMLAGPEVLDLIPRLPEADIGFHLLPRLVDHMVGHRIGEFLMDIGTMENYSVAQTTWPGLKHD